MIAKLIAGGRTRGGEPGSEQTSNPEIKCPECSIKWASCPFELLSPLDLQRRALRDIRDLMERSRRHHHNINRINAWRPRSTLRKTLCTRTGLVGLACFESPAKFTRCVATSTARAWVARASG